MNPRIAIATCPAFPTLYEDDRLLLGPLRAAGLEADPVVWSDPAVPWDRYDAVLVRSVWDYHLHIEAFRAFIDRIEGLGVALWNSPALLRWNLDKRYLDDLARRGVATLPTQWLTEAEGAVERILEMGPLHDELVLKPAVSAGAYRTLRLLRGEVAAQRALVEEILAHSALMVQPFARQVVEEGEYSFLFLGGEYSHGVLKRPAAGDFRVQQMYQGRHVRVTPEGALVRQAEAVLALLPEVPLYARVDGIVDDGHLLLMELELIEPFLFLAEWPAAAVRLSAACAGRLV